MPAERIKVRLRFQKLVTCGHCGCVYREGSPHKFAGRGGTVAEANERAEQKARRNWGDPEPLPCPCCYRFAREVVARAQFVRLFFIVLLTPTVLLPLGLMAAIAARGPQLSSDGAALVVGATILVACSTAALTLWLNPNRNPARNRTRARVLVADGEVTVVQPPAVAVGSLPVPPARACALWLVAVGLLVAPATQAARVYRVLNGWELSPAVDPQFVCPGDRVKVRFSERVRSVNFLWFGKANGTLVGPDGARRPVGCRTNQETWGAWIEARHNDESELWAEFDLPNDPALAGTRVQLHATLDVTYPVWLAGNKYQDDKKWVEKTVDVWVAPASAGARYKSAHLFGTLGGFALVFAVISGFALAAFVARRAETMVALEQLADGNGS